MMIQAQAQTPASAPTFSPREWKALRALRGRYHQDRDFFSKRESARLDFLRWLYRTGQVVP